MNISYHYFAVKVLAIKAGFKEEDAQRIAFYSQAVDDYDSCTPILLETIPAYAKHLAKRISDKWLFYPVTTGFSNWFDYARLVLESNQRSITIPFHFIPPQMLTVPVSSRTEYRVIPAHLSTPSLIQEMLLKARNNYFKSPAPANLILIGMLLHIFADTYAHQNFSGFWGWENNAKLTVAVSPVNTPPIGHANLNRIPDDSSLTYSWEQKCSGKDNYSITYTRSNTEEFCNVSLEILNYLLSCNRQASIATDDWSDFKESLKLGFLTTEKEFTKLSAYWQTYFPEMEFHYQKANLFKATDDLFQFNVFADDIRRKVNGIPNKEIDFNNYIMQVSDDDAQLGRLATFQANN